MRAKTEIMTPHHLNIYIQGIFTFAYFPFQELLRASDENANGSVNQVLPQTYHLVIHIVGSIGSLFRVIH